MKKYLAISISFVLLIFLSGCLKKDHCDSKSVQSEQAAILAFATANGITATAHSSGLYYQIITQGSGPSPSMTSTVTAKYKGTLLDGTVFDEQLVTPIMFPMTAFIQGWQIGLPLIQKGGTIKLLVPSALGYGCKSFGGVPGNSTLYFEIELVNVQ